MSTDPKDSTAFIKLPSADPKDDTAPSNFEDSTARKKTIPKDHRPLPATDPKHSSARKPPSTAGPKDNTARRLPAAMKLGRTADELDTSISGVYALVNAGKLDLIKMGPKSSRITGESVERLLAQRVKPDSNIPNLKQFKNTPDQVSGD